jgi:hypothetical protein
MKENHAANPISKGVLRHRLITSGCIALSLAVLGLAATDLRGVFERAATIDTSLKISYIATDTHLDSGLIPFNNFSEGLRPVRRGFNDSEEGYVNEAGQLVIPTVYGEPGSFSEGLASVRVSDDPPGVKKEKTEPNWSGYGYINHTGKLVIPAKYTDAGEFKDGVAPVEINHTGALINRAGKVIIWSKSTEAPKRFGNVYQIHTSGFRSGLVDKTGAWILPANYEKIEPFTDINNDELQIPLASRSTEKRPDYQYFKIWQNGKCGVVNNLGKVVLDAKYDDVASFNKGKAAVKFDGGLYGFVDGNNKVVIEPKYDFVTVYDDVIAAKKDKSWSLMDSNGKVLNTSIEGVIANDSDPWLSEGFGPIIVGKQCGFVNTKGAIVLKPQYDFVFGYSDGYAAALRNGVWSFLDKNGVASKQSFSEASSFRNKVANVNIAGPLYKFVCASQIEAAKRDVPDRLTDFKSGMRRKI